MRNSENYYNGISKNRGGRLAIEACSETKAKMDELEYELANIVGLHHLKVQLRKWAKGMQVGPRRPPHVAFLGNPGTGYYLLVVDSFWNMMFCLLLVLKTYCTLHSLFFFCQNTLSCP